MKPIKIISTILLIGGLFLIAGCGGGGGGSTSQPLSGYVTYGGQGVEGITVTLSGPVLRTTTTDANGYYVFNDVDGSEEYTVTPSDTRAGVTVPYTFAPFKRTAYMSDVEATDFDFNAIGPQRVSSSTHTLFVKSDGTVWAWGLNTSSQLGDGTTTNQTAPIQIGASYFNATTKAIAVAAGGDFSLVLRADGTVWAWGANTNGQLGLGDNTDRTTPAQITSLSGITAISAGYGHAAAVKSDGTIWTWGLNTDGQLGDVSNTNRNVPVLMGGGIDPYDTYFTSTTPAIAVSAGYDHTLALRSDGYVYAWGGNSAGQLGVGSIDTTSYNYPAAVSSNAVQVAAGHQFSAVLWYYAGNAGLVATCGAYNKGQIGRSIEEVEYSYYFGAINMDDVATISAGRDHVTAVKSNGTVWTWGGNDYGQLGIGSVDANAHLTPVQIGTAVNIAQIAAGTYDMIALGATAALADTMYVWGDNAYGQLGNGGVSANAPYSLTLP